MKQTTEMRDIDGSDKQVGQNRCQKTRTSGGRRNIREPFIVGESCEIFESSHVDTVKHEIGKS